MEINISKMDKIEVFRALYNKAKTQGMGIFQFEPSDMSREEAESIFNQSNDKYFDYVKGRVMKVDLSGDILDTRLYDRDNGEGKAQMVIEILGKIPEKKASFSGISEY